MIYLLDTNTCIQYLTRRNSAILNRLARQRRQDVVLCDIVKAELYYGAYRGTRLESNLALDQEFFSEFVSLPFDGNTYRALRIVHLKWSPEQIFALEGTD